MPGARREVRRALTLERLFARPRFAAGEAASARGALGDRPPMNDPLRCPRPPPAPTVIPCSSPAADRCSRRARSTCRILYPPPGAGRVASPRIGPRLRPAGTGPEPEPGGGGSLAAPLRFPMQPGGHSSPRGNHRADNTLAGDRAPRDVGDPTPAWAGRRAGDELTPRAGLTIEVDVLHACAVECRSCQVRVADPIREGS